MITETHGYRNIERATAQIRIKPDVSRLRQVQERESWFKVRTLEQANRLIPIFEDKALELQESLTQLSCSDSAENTLQLARNFVRRVARTNGRRLAEDFAMGKAQKMFENHFAKCAMASMWGNTEDNDPEEIPPLVNNMITGNINKVGMFLKWQAMADLPQMQDLKNPYAPIVDIMTLGGTNVRLDGDLLRTDVPLLLDGYNRVLGCWKSGDSTIRLGHTWENKCSDVQNLRRVS